MTFYIKIQFILLDSESENEESEDEEGDKGVIEFTISFSESEWKSIKPRQSMYKRNERNRAPHRSYDTMQQNEWSPFAAKSFLGSYPFNLYIGLSSSQYR